MLLTLSARHEDKGGQTVGYDLAERARIFVRDYACHGPCSSGVFRWKGSATTLKKRTAAIPLIRSLATQGVLQCFHRYQAVQRRFAGEESGFTPILIVPDMSQQPHSCGTACECRHTGVRQILVVTDCARVM